ncbi:conserved hypothetical protein [delta proteobacterium NaphS2]|nr:conserved hypothetical protein [delta proteobacterium NaphS2]
MLKPSEGFRRRNELVANNELNKPNELKKLKSAKVHARSHIQNVGEV